MNRRQAVLSLGGVALAAGAQAANPPGDVRVWTETGHRDLTGEEAVKYQAAKAWMQQRLKDVESIRVGSTYADVIKHFRRDGGISEITNHRFVLVLCPFVKIDVEFEDKPEVKARQPVAATARVTSVSRAYFEGEFGD